MIKETNKITPFQLFFVLIQAQIGIGVISLPHDIFMVSKSDAWISVLVAGFLIEINILLIWLLYRRFPSMTIFEMLHLIIGKPASYVLKVLYILYFLSTLILVIMMFGRMVNIWILPRTPVWVLSLLLIVICIYCVKENIKVMARFNVVVSICLVVLFVLIAFVIKETDFRYILPVASQSFPSILKGAQKATSASLGYELLLVLFPLCMGKQSTKLKVALLANGFATFFYTYLTIVSITYFGPAVMKLIPEPILYIMKFHSFQIIERTDLLFFSIWIVSVATSFMVYLYCCTNGVVYLLKKVKHGSLAIAIGLLVYILFLFFPPTEEAIKLFGKYHSLASYFFIFIIPLLLLFVAIVRGKKETSGAANS
ncbi:GerAB/ArcD/ProY family transporter [Bacillus massiliigorillae]|uniref:GerAB/ArcD/ProY family transporter n=1 Tax=Bacillus massiliigorillae TaxID=1243664 RepID=UPI0003A853A0|nr:endospore germination permease [Bacillus massiliigorillae]